MRPKLTYANVVATNGATNFGTEGPFTYSPVGFYKDHEGVSRVTSKWSTN
jgi:hypothetical protein